MRFLYYDLIFLAIFGIFVISFLYKRRKNLKREGILYLYRTKIGIKFINYAGKKYKKVLNVLQYFSIVLGFFLMVGIFYILILAVYVYKKFPEITTIIKAPPIMPLIPYFPKLFGVQSFFPPFYFTYFILAILVVAVVHEFSHGIFAKMHKLEIKSTGFAFLGPIIGAFVEPDEKEMKKKSKFAQMSILSAGTFANTITAVIFFLIMFSFFALFFTPAGVTFDSYVPAIINITSINSISNYNFEKPNAENILELIESKEIEETGSLNLTKIETNTGTYFTKKEDLKIQLEAEQESIFVYGDFPAINAGLKGIIIEFDGREIKSNEDLTSELAAHKPGDRVRIKTKFNDEFLTFDLILGESPNDKDRAFLGISSMSKERGGFSGILYSILYLDFYKKEGTAYEPKLDGNLIPFIFNLLFWIVLINFFVALFNMLPLGFLDGGRFFLLAVWGITKNEKIAHNAYRIMGYLILAIFLLLMLFWFLAFR